MEISVEVNRVSISFFLYVIGQGTEIRQIAFFVKEYAFIESYPLSINHFLGDGF
jgi:hypothetical protein